MITHGVKSVELCYDLNIGALRDDDEESHDFNTLLKLFVHRIQKRQLELSGRKPSLPISYRNAFNAILFYQRCYHHSMRPCHKHGVIPMESNEKEYWKLVNMTIRGVRSGVLESSFGKS